MKTAIECDGDFFSCKILKVIYIILYEQVIDYAVFLIATPRGK